jgi:hypothetical protein
MPMTVLGDNRDRPTASGADVAGVAGAVAVGEVLAASGANVLGDARR